MHIDSCVNHTIPILSLKDRWIYTLNQEGFSQRPKKHLRIKKTTPVKLIPAKNAFEKLVEEEMIFEEDPIMVRPGKESIKMINLFHRP
ncbi:hypothetical protein CEXT_724231 [Caerostris extrusa]|uniref:Uncharacterized protein n=1 Tax=Caerostris extrusa TaxID=172846 RepID=A0AAV4QKI7_CAEEX|nr:hypothetical protein CEXT_724231 [Caerostris extrusa]